MVSHTLWPYRGSIKQFTTKKWWSAGLCITDQFNVCRDFLGQRSQQIRSLQSLVYHSVCSHLFTCWTTFCAKVVQSMCECTHPNTQALLWSILWSDSYHTFSRKKYAFWFVMCYPQFKLIFPSCFLQKLLTQSLDSLTCNSHGCIFKWKSKFPKSNR